MAKPVPGLTALKALTVELDDKAEVLAELNLGSLWDRLMAEALDAYAASARRGLSVEEIASEIESALQSLSENMEEGLARGDAGVAYNEGRAVEGRALALAGEAKYAVRTEVLDQRTCDACKEWDGFVAEIDSSDYEAAMPPAYCEGGDNCRGFYIILDEGVDPADFQDAAAQG